MGSRGITTTLATLGADADCLTPTQVSELDERGYTLLPAAIDTGWLGALRARLEDLWEAEGDVAGVEGTPEVGTRRFSDLVNKGPQFDGVYTHPRVLAAVFQTRSVSPHRREPSPCSTRMCGMAVP